MAARAVELGVVAVVAAVAAVAEVARTEAEAAQVEKWEGAAGRVKGEKASRVVVSEAALRTPEAKEAEATAH